jgi:hypothetical protein
MSASKMEDIKGAIASTIIDNSLSLEDKKKLIMINTATSPTHVSSSNLNSFIRTLQVNNYI